MSGFFLTFVYNQKARDMATKKAINYYGTFHGLYEWGKGWVSSEAREKWEYWWNNIFPTMRTIRWKSYIPSNEPGVCGSLVSSSNAIYMHPMAFYGTFVSGGVISGCSLPEEDYKYDYKYVFLGELEELDEICKAVAEYCGGSFVMDTTAEFDIVIPNERYVFTDKTDYLHNCAERKESPYYKPKEKEA
jgi:hypothetical protein